VKGDAKKLIERGNQLFDKRAGLESLWQEIALNFYVERANFTAVLAVGDEFAAHLNSSYPLIVRRELGNAFSAMLRPRDEEWFAISIEREDRLDRAGREWLEWASQVQRRAMYDRKAMFTRATKEGDHDFAAFGQTVISREIDWKEQALLYRCWHLKDVAWNERYNGEIGEVHRKWKPQIGYLHGRFKNLHRSVARAVPKDAFKEIDCRHIVIPSEDYEGRWRTPYVSVYLDADNHHVMEEVGSWSSVYTIPRWQTVSGSQYAYSPATVAGLPDGRLLQAMTLTLLEAGEMAVRPPMVAVREAIRSDIQIFSGGITSVDAEYDERLGEVLRPLVQDKTGLPFGMEISRDTREMLAACFYLNKLTLPPADREMTAYETSQRIQEYIRSALPLFEPMETDYNGSLCEGTFEDLLRVGAFSGREMPRSLSGQQVRFTFKSPLHDAIERKRGTKFVEALELTKQAIEIDPSTLPTLDVRKSFRDALNSIGTPAAWLRDEEIVEQFAAEQEANQKAQQMAQQIGGAAAVGEQVGKAKQALEAA
jgi:hypothetical protein